MGNGRFLWFHLPHRFHKLPLDLASLIFGLAQLLRGGFWWWIEDAVPADDEGENAEPDYNKHDETGTTATRVWNIRRYIVRGTHRCVFIKPYMGPRELRRMA